MTVDERNRLQLAEAAKRVLGDDEGITLSELRSQSWKIFGLYAATMGAFIGALVAVAKL